MDMTSRQATARVAARRGRSAIAGARGLSRDVREVDLAALGGELDLVGVATQLLPARFDGGAEAVEEVVGVHRIVVKQEHPVDPGAPAEGQRVGERRVPPAD